MMLVRGKLPKQPLTTKQPLPKSAARRVETSAVVFRMTPPNLSNVRFLSEQARHHDINFTAGGISFRRSRCRKMGPRAYPRIHLLRLVDEPRDTLTGLAAAPAAAVDRVRSAHHRAHDPLARWLLGFGNAAIGVTADGRHAIGVLDAVGAGWVRERPVGFAADRRGARCRRSGGVDRRRRFRSGRFRATRGERDEPETHGRLER